VALRQLVEEYSEAVLDTDRERAMRAIDSALSGGVAPEEVVFQLVIPSLENMVRAMEQDFDANLAQHYMVSQIAAEVTDAMVARFAQPPEPVGTIIIGTAHGDLHTLGKRIVTGCLKSLMVSVIDVGVNVAPERFVDEAVERGANVIAVSTMMLHTARGDLGPQAVRQILADRGLERSIRLVVGGAPYRFDQDLYRTVGADAWSPDGVSAGHLIRDLAKGTK
jgi:methanogenic corrinoid protein MtbC1